jgi:sorbitol-specific phosphotransferase system component IIBC
MIHEPTNPFSPPRETARNNRQVALREFVPIVFLLTSLLGYFYSTTIMDAVTEATANEAKGQLSKVLILSTFCWLLSVFTGLYAVISKPRIVTCIIFALPLLFLAAVISWIAIRRIFP